MQSHAPDGIASSCRPGQGFEGRNAGKLELFGGLHIWRRSNRALGWGRIAAPRRVTLWPLFPNFEPAAERLPWLGVPTDDIRHCRPSVRRRSGARHDSRTAYHACRFCRLGCGVRGTVSPCGWLIARQRWPHRPAAHSPAFRSRLFGIGHQFPGVRYAGAEVRYRKRPAGFLFVEGEEWRRVRAIAARGCRRGARGASVEVVANGLADGVRLRKNRLWPVFRPRCARIAR